MGPDTRDLKADRESTLKSEWKARDDDRKVRRLPFIMSGQNHLARRSERRRKTRQTEKEVGRQHRGMDRPAVREVPECSGEQRNIEGKKLVV